jgi:hypothetical protein
LAGVLGGCNNGDGGGSSNLLLFFGINGSGNCNNVIIDVNLDEAGGVIARDDDGDLQCELSDDLADDGCELDLELDSNGDLTATIDGCDGNIPGGSNLFSCEFEDVDLSDLRETATGQCDCVNAQGCDETPPVCISIVEDFESCEDCDNGIDDDENGFTDCDDPKCVTDPDCVGTTTSTTSTSITITTSSTTLTTVTTSSTITTTTLQPILTCQLFLRLDDDVTLGSLQVDIDYSDAPGQFPGDAGQVECSGLIGGGALTQFNDRSDEELMTVGIISVSGFAGPTNIADCTFTANVQPVPADFDITVTEASDADPENPQPVEGVTVSVVPGIVCEGNVVTTTTIGGGDTTTTLGDVTTTTVVVGNTFNVAFRLTAASAAVGALQFHVEYAGAPGEFPGVAGQVECTSPIAGLFAPNDLEDQNQLNLGIVSTAGFSAPTDVANCNFTGNGETPEASDFVIVIEDATDTTEEGNSITESIVVVPVVTPKP